MRLFAADPATRKASGDSLFRDTVWPTLNRKCLGCHGDDPKKICGGLDLRTREGALKGGASGWPSIVLKEPEKSPLYLVVTRKETNLVMPSKATGALDGRRRRGDRRIGREGRRLRPPDQGSPRDAPSSL